MPVNTHLFALFLATIALVMIAPGPDMLFVLGCGMRGGPRAGLLATAGVATSEALHITVAAAGLSAFFAAAPVAFDAMRIIGAAYLIWLGVQTIRHRGQEQDEDDPGAAAPRVSGRRAYARGLLTNLLNPKMVTFSIAFLPQFVDPSHGRVWLQFALLGAVFVTVEFLVDGTVGILAGRTGTWLRRRRAARRRLDTATGGLLIGLGLGLAVER
jgi:threonine/homoserine/homoserine lactone efflux protein